VTEIASVHGSSEAIDSPLVVHQPVPGNFVRQTLARGYRLGFVGSGDGHDGHPGLTRLYRGASGGLAGIYADALTREAVLAALRARRCFATNGPRIVLYVTLDGAPMGSVHRVGSPGATARLAVQAFAEGRFRRIDVIRGDEVVHQVPGEERARIAFTWPLEALVRGETVYVRAVQTDDGAAWSSPFFVE
jgi:hypothetical protein